MYSTTPIFQGSPFSKYPQGTACTCFCLFLSAFKTEISVLNLLPFSELYAKRHVFLMGVRLMRFTEDGLLGNIILMSSHMITYKKSTTVQHSISVYASSVTRQEARIAQPEVLVYSRQRAFNTRYRFQEVW